MTKDHERSQKIMKDDENRKTTQNIIKDKEISWNTTKYHKRKIGKDDER